MARNITGDRAFVLACVENGFPVPNGHVSAVLAAPHGHDEGVEAGTVEGTRTRLHPQEPRVTRIGWYTTPILNTLTNHGYVRDLVFGTNDRTIVNVEVLWLTGRVLASRADDAALAAMLSAADPMAALVDVLKRRAPDAGEWTRTMAKAAFFLWLNHSIPASYADALTDEQQQAALRALAGEFSAADAWLGGRQRTQRWVSVETTAAALCREILEAAWQLVGTEPGNPEPILVDRSLPVLLVDTPLATRFARRLQEVATAILIAGTHVPSAPHTRPTVFGLTGHQLDLTTRL